MKITGLRLRELVGTLEHHDEPWEDRLIRPMDVYPEHQAASAYTGFWHPIKLDDGRYRIQLVFLEIETDEAGTGLAGPIGHEVASIIDQQFRGLLMGEDPRATERIWDKMYRISVHGRTGAPMLAIRAIDCALWDLKGRWLGQPVRRLLGGPVRTALPAYERAGGTVPPRR